MTKANERRQFRFALVKDILRCESVRNCHMTTKSCFSGGWRMAEHHRYPA